MRLIENFHEIFPTRQCFGLFLLYICLFVNQGWLVTLSQETNNDYKYDTSLAVLFCEFLKLLCVVIIYSFQNSVLSLLKEARGNSKMFFLYFIPASLYAIYNNLTYINLSTFDPTTYFVVLQMRVALTGLIFQVFFDKKLTSKQWVSLGILTIGCIIKQLNFGDMPEIEKNKAFDKQLGISFSFSSLLLFAQILCSCLAGVYNEYLLKSNSGEVNVFIQNAFHYINSIICLVFILTWKSRLPELFTLETYKPFLNSTVMLVICNNVAIGIVTSFFLKYLNSILKTFAGALELVITAVLSRILFHIPIYISTVLSIILITIATIFYTQNPVINTKKCTKNVENLNSIQTFK